MAAQRQIHVVAVLIINHGRLVLCL